MSQRKIDQIDLMDHQQRQIDFLHKHLTINPVVGINSPTGSGKTIMVLKYIAERLKEAQAKGRPFNVVFSTGFNVLVDQVKSTIEDLFGVEANTYSVNSHGMITIGSNTGNTTTNTNSADDAGFNLYTLASKSLMFPNVKQESAKTTALGQLLQILSNTNDPTSKVVVTNHTCLWMYRDLFAKYDLIIVDEVHTYPMFQELANTIEISAKDIDILRSMIETRAQIGNPYAKVFLSGLNMGKVPNRPLHNLTTDKFEEELGIKLGNKKQPVYTARRFLKQFYTISEAKNNIDQFCQVLDNGNLHWTRFQKCSDIYGAQIICLSATIDSKTREFMGISPWKNNFFQENDRRYYQNSAIHVYPTMENEEALAKKMADWIQHNYANGGLGLIYSTTLSFVATAKRILSTVTEVHTTVESFQASTSTNKVLIGSTRFSMGLDLPGFDYLLMNRIPFDRYDEEYRAKQAYFEHVVGKSAWFYMAVADVENRMNQLIGRLWRDYDNPNAKSKTIVIWDSRFIPGNKTYHEKLLKNIERPGMKEVIHNEEKDNNANN